MKPQRSLAIIERDMRKFLRSPALMMSSMIFPLMQLIVLGYAFGGKIKGIKVAVVDEDRTVYSRDLRERFEAIVAGPQTMQVENYSSISDATVDLRAGFVRARDADRVLAAARVPHLAILLHRIAHRL